MIIAYGTENITLNKDNGESIILTRKELAFIVQSAIKNQEVEIVVLSNETKE